MGGQLGRGLVSGPVLPAAEVSVGKRELPGVLELDEPVQALGRRSNAPFASLSAMSQLTLGHGGRP